MTETDIETMEAMGLEARLDYILNGIKEADAFIDELLAENKKLRTYIHAILAIGHGAVADSAETQQTSPAESHSPESPAPVTAECDHADLSEPLLP